MTLPAVALSAALCAAAACTTTPPQAGTTASPSAAPARVLDPEEIGHSANMRLLANVPLDAPFDVPEAWGTDLAFQGDYAFVGNYEGFAVHDIGDPAHPEVVTRVACPGVQNDISVSGDLLFLSIDEPRTDDTCAGGPTGPEDPSGWEGIRIFDISDKAHPRYVSAVRTECGSHTHTIVPGKDTGTVYLYVSSPGPVPGSESCPAPHENISIVEVPVANPRSARVVATPELFPEQRPEDESFAAGCHDITAYPEKGLAAGACFGDGVLMDISDPVAPRVLQIVSDRDNFSIWHSATFNNAGTKIVFSDESGGGLAPTCGASDDPTKGADAVYELTPDRRLVRHAYFKIPRVQDAKENCVAHNGSLIPVPGRDVMVQAWYMGGVSVWDFTDSDHPKEIAYFERGPLPRAFAGSWSAYYYNGHIYSSDITEGLDVLRLDDPLTDPAKAVRMTELNAQTQRSYG
ncbi:LVIVD repeat-containing protein [Planotetraspora thailandica]|uniref:LVIVD repeat-containing protein n=1 Tax=Planotetraspora thailandica TaxID=487172 RepID=UPI001950DA48